MKIFENLEKIQDFSKLELREKVREREKEKRIEERSFKVRNTLEIY